MTTIHIASGPNEETTTPPQLFAGDTPAVATKDVLFTAAQGAFAQYVPLSWDATNNIYIAWADGATIDALTAYAIPDQAVDQRAGVYVAGCFNYDVIAWPGSTTETMVEEATAKGGNLKFRKPLYSDKR